MEEEDENFVDEVQFCFILSLQIEICSQEDENKGAWLRQGIFLTEENTSAKKQETWGLLSAWAHGFNVS